MSIETSRAFLRDRGIESRVLEFDVSSATVELAAAALGVEPARICKSLSFKLADCSILVLAAGDARIDNRKFKDYFGVKPKMLSAEEVLENIGHPVGGVCPFGIHEGVRVFADRSLERFVTVFPAVGSGNSAIELNLEELYNFSAAECWVDVCKIPEIES